MNKGLLAAALMMAIFSNAHAADLQLKNIDGPGHGLNDRTPAAPVGGNTGVTLGAQRQRVYQFAMALWGEVLGSNAPVVIEASFPLLQCDSISAILGSASSVWSYTDHEYHYHGALANALMGWDLDPSRPEIRAQFNPNLGAPNCLAGSGWYLGLDGNTPEGKVNFLSVVMHEIAHGLGFSGMISLTSGRWRIADRPDVYSARALATSTGKTFAQSTEQERMVAMRTPGGTAWSGQHVTRNAALLLDDGYVETFTVTAPAAVAGNYAFQNATFGPPATPANFNGKWVLAEDAESADGPLKTDGCSPLLNAQALAGNIAVIERGTCSFVAKALHAQQAGATAVVIVNTASGAFGSMGGEDSTIHIPALMVQHVAGLAFIAHLPVTGGLLHTPTNTKFGLDANGRALLYTPVHVAGGSTFSHFDTSLSPSALMEPFTTPGLQSQLTLDLTPALLRDIGWPINNGTTKLFNGACDTGVPALADGGFVIGANIAAHDVVCRIDANRTSYYNCMNANAGKLLSQSLINVSQKNKIVGCARRISDNWGR